MAGPRAWPSGCAVIIVSLVGEPACSTLSPCMAPPRAGPLASAPHMGPAVVDLDPVAGLMLCALGAASGNDYPEGAAVQEDQLAEGLHRGGYGAQRGSRR